MNKLLKKSLVFILLINISLLFFSSAFAQNEQNQKDKAEGRSCTLAKNPSECKSADIECKGKDGKTEITYWGEPVNCLFLLEPIGGKNNWDLYTHSCDLTTKKCSYVPYGGGSIPANSTGPHQAVITKDASKAYQGPFGLLYSYVGLIYKYMSGLIIGVVVLFIVIGGIRITYSQGGEELGKGKDMILKAILGLIVWFTASLILYTINPTFFVFTAS